jgi:hypothetical protein
MVLLMSILTASVLSADPSKSSADAAAIVVEVEGDAFVRIAGRNHPAKCGERLSRGDLLLLDEDAEALLLYSTGKYSRVRGPARVHVDRMGADQQGRSLGDRLKNRLVGSFSTQRRRRVTSTVAGVRGGDAVLLSPAEHGITTARFPIVVRPRVTGSRPLNDLALSDEVRVVGLDGDRELFRVKFDADRLTQTSPPIDLKDAPRDRAYAVEVRLVEVDDDGQVTTLRHIQRATFRLADKRSDDELALALEALGQEQLSGAAAILARVNLCVERDFQGMAAAEVALVAAKHPENPFWTELMLSLIADAADQDTDAR